MAVAFKSGSAEPLALPIPDSSFQYLLENDHNPKRKIK
jgi:hypothetical protein